MVMYNSINNILLNKLSGKVSKVPLKKVNKSRTVKTGKQ